MLAGMHVTTDISRLDLIRFNLYFLPRLKGNWVVFGVLALCIFVYALFDKRPSDGAGFFVAAVVSAIGALGGFVVGTLISLVTLLVGAGSKQGVLGQHHYQLTADGLHERTAVNEGLLKWAGVEAVGKARSFIYIRTTGHLFHIFPRKAFADKPAYDAFWLSAHGHWQAAGRPH